MKPLSAGELWRRLRRRLRQLAAWLRGDPPPVLDGRCSNAAGSRTYRLYRPGWHYLGARPLVVMLHGCKQSPDDFAAGTRMHARGAGRGCFVLYPGQDRQANPMGCWNWFEARHQRREQGEPSILADMVREVIAGHRIDPRRIYVAGLSAGGAMAAILATTHPELFAAVGIHSGLPHGAASNLFSALTVMKHGPTQRRAGQAGMPGASRPSVPTIVFHGDHDTTVHPNNGVELIARTRWTSSSAGVITAAASLTIRGEVPGGRAYTQTVHHDTGRGDAEHWVIHGSGHAWSGGDPAGSYTDPLGPDSSREMLRFFRAHPQKRPPPARPRG